ncbi:tRNA pseudouridine(13) synthase TruD [Gynuella sp.]|uniref:tRNA pseudouridine(13) synthase TruD n=1 Tax=Gynuella sp. TaxID=2969146 RepID=UPI003D1471AE
MADLNYDFARALSLVVEPVDFKQQPVDFIVEEELRFELTGAGEHLYILIEKEQQNTHWCAKQIARWANVPNRHVSFAGLKDRQGVTRQWFSIWLPGKPDPEGPLEIEGVSVIDQRRHRAKLQRGALSSNRFHIVLRGVQGNLGEIEEGLTRIAAKGVPNYFGPQRFGVDHGNVTLALGRPAQEWLEQNRANDIYVSAVRSYLFNSLLHHRILQDNWSVPQVGEPLILSGSNSWFVAEGTDDELIRIEQGDCSTSGVMYSGPTVLDESPAFSLIELELLHSYAELTDWLTPLQLKPLRRPLILRPNQLQWTFLDNHTLSLSFGLPSGTYATSVLRELFSF